MKKAIEILSKLRVIYSGRQQIKFSFLFVLIVISAFFELVGISLILPFINVVINPSIITTNKYLENVYNFLNMNNSTSFLIFLAVVLQCVDK